MTCDISASANIVGHCQLIHIYAYCSLYCLHLSWGILILVSYNNKIYNLYTFPPNSGLQKHFWCHWYLCICFYSSSSVCSDSVELSSKYKNPRIDVMCHVFRKPGYFMWNVILIMVSVVAGGGGGGGRVCLCITMCFIFFC